MLVISLLADGFAPNSKILAISLRKDSGGAKNFLPSNYSSSDELLGAFFSYFLAENDKILTGYNLLKFDLPLIALAGASLNEFPTFFRELNRSNVVDLFPIMTALNRGQIKSLSFYCRQFSVPEPPSREALIKLFHDGKTKELSLGLELTTESLLDLSEKLRSRLNSANLLGGT